MKKYKGLQISLCVLIICMYVISGCMYSNSPKHTTDDAHTHEGVHTHGAYDHPTWLRLSNDGILTLQPNDYLSDSLAINIFEFPEGSSYWVASSLYGELSQMKSEGTIVRHADNIGPMYSLPKTASKDFFDQIDFSFFNEQDKLIGNTRVCILYSQTDAMFHAFETESIINTNEHGRRPALEWASEDIAPPNKQCTSHAA